MGSDMIQTGRLAGKVAIVTGVGAGIGKGCALMFARQGAQVVGCDIDPDQAAATAAEALATGGLKIGRAHV